MEKLEPSYIMSGTLKPGKQFGSFLRSFNLPYNIAICLLHIYLREMKIHVHAKSYAKIFTTALFMIA